MAAVVASPIFNSIAGCTRQVFKSHTEYQIPGVENFSADDLSSACAAILHSESTTDLNAAALFNALQFVSQDRSVPATLLRSRSPTLPLDEDAGGERGQGTYNKELMSIYDTASHEHRGNAAGKATTRRLQNGKSTARRVLKPVSSRISKTSPKERVLRHGTPRQQHEAAHSGEKMGNSQKTRQVEPQDSNFTSPATFPIHQADEPGNLNDQPYSCDQELQSHRESIDIHREGAQRATSSRTRALESKLSIKRNAESPASSKIPKRSRRNPAQGARHKKQKDERKIPRENKTRRGRVSKRPEKYGFTWE